MAIDQAINQGGCLCGAVRYRVIGSPRSSSVCHCRSCRLAAGAQAVAWFVVAMDQFELTAGALKRFGSSSQVIREFCDRCGTQISYRHDDSPGDIELTTASLDEPAAFPPTREIWLSHKLPWAVSDPALEHYAQDSGK